MSGKIGRGFGSGGGGPMIFPEGEETKKMVVVVVVGVTALCMKMVELQCTIRDRVWSVSPQGWVPLCSVVFYRSH